MRRDAIFVPTLGFGAQLRGLGFSARAGSSGDRRRGLYNFVAPSACRAQAVGRSTTAPILPQIPVGPAAAVPPINQ